MARGATNCRTHRWWVSSNRHSGARVSANPESRDSGFDAEPVIGPRFARTRWHRPGMTVLVASSRSLSSGAHSRDPLAPRHDKNLSKRRVAAIDHKTIGGMVRRRLAHQVHGDA